MLLVGIVRRPHALSGEVSVEIVTDFPQRFASGAKLIWRRGEETRELEIATARRNRDRMLLAFTGVQDLEHARALAGGELLVSGQAAYPAPPGFYYSHDLEGFRCEDAGRRPLGFVRGLSQTAAGPMLTLETVAGKEALVPFVEEMVLEVDRDGKRIVLELPEGLLDL